ncbi:MAG: FAD-dependent monooxygenase, partial [Pseudomonadota bacterium]
MGEPIEVDVAIVGAGLSGLTLACALVHSAPRLRLAIIDKRTSAPEPLADMPDLRVSALTPGSIANFDTLGVWQHLPPTHVTPFRGMRVWDAGTDAGNGVAFSALDSGRSDLGAITDNAMLRWQLHQALCTERNIQWIDAGVTDLLTQRGSASLTLEHGQSIVCRLIVGADGRNSSVRRLAGLAVHGWSHEQQAVVCHLNAEMAHEGVALQRFLASGPLALLPLSEQRVSLVWSTSPTAAEQLLAMDDDAFADAVTEASDEVLGRLQPITGRAAFTLVSQYAEQVIGERVVLIGDAAHAIHPLAGQGANLGFSDAAALAASLQLALARREDVGDAPVLRRFRRARKADNV